jgi:SAM-dependent methyltransferase
MQCRLCTSRSTALFCTDSNRDFYRCDTCSLIFVPEKDYVSIAAEKERYRLHNNTFENSEYVAYLQSVAGELQRIPLKKPAVLDYGCGEHKVLTRLLRRQGIPCTPYDPLYDSFFTAAEHQFDVVVLCEVIEHFRDIRKEEALIDTVLKPGGYILIKTEIYDEHRDFSTWWYTKDSTHINFFTLPALEKFGEMLRKKMAYTDVKNIVIMN